VLQYLSRTEQALIQLPEVTACCTRRNTELSSHSSVQDDVRSSQPSVEAALVKLLTQLPTQSSPAPRPGRPARHIISRCFLVLFQRGETRTLFDVVQTLTKPMADPKADKEARVSVDPCHPTCHTLTQGAQCLFLCCR
jgi:hypothetical protein